MECNIQNIDIATPHAIKHCDFGHLDLTRDHWHRAFLCAEVAKEVELAAGSRDPLSSLVRGDRGDSSAAVELLSGA